MKMRIRKLREARGLTQEQLASALGVTQPTIGRLERGQQNVSLKLLNATADYFCVSIPELFEYEGGKNAILRRLSDLSPEDEDRALAVLQAVLRPRSVLPE